MPNLKFNDGFEPYYEIHDHTDPWSDEPKETILFIHGFAENTKAWYAWIPGLSRKYRLLMYDVRGLGQSGAVNSDFNYSTDLLVDDVVRIVNAIVGGPVHVVSAKSGAITALRFAATRPDLVKSVILTCPPLTAPGHSDWVPHIDQYGMRSYVRWTMPARLGKDASPKCLDWWVDLMGSAPISTAHAYFRWVVTTDPLSDLEKVTCPVLAIMTTPSPENNTGAGQRSPDVLRKAAPQADVVVFEMDCYHASAMAPDRCVQETLRFLGNI